MDYYVTHERIHALLKDWTSENLRALHNKMKTKGMMTGGILRTRRENRALFEYLETVIQ